MTNPHIHVCVSSFPTCHASSHHLTLCVLLCQCKDIKSSNILITNRYQLKLADFGLARSTTASDGKEFRNNFTNNVVTMWYKCPELLLGGQNYSYPVDVWSAGCKNYANLFVLIKKHVVNFPSIFI